PEEHLEQYTFFRTFYENTRKCFTRIFSRAVSTADTGSLKTAEKLLARDAEKILATKPDVIGFSVQNDQAAYSLALAKILRSNSGAKIIMGGYFPSAGNPLEILNAFDWIDGLVVREGERPFVELLKLMSGERKKAVPGYIHRSKNGITGKALSCECIEPDEAPPPDFSGYDMNGYWSPKTVLPYLTSRGCPWGRCSFCAHRENYGNYREKSPKRVGEEIGKLKARYGARHFLICDEQIDGARLEAICRKIKGEDVTFGLAGLKPGAGVSARRLKKASASGCKWVYLGVESFSS
ncbi:MAG TPA: radical SAM protein, partial [bacterium]|nr:radical SAM protein [bacterium]